MARAVLITGGNLDDVKTNLQRAAELIGRRIGTVAARSSVAESEPWGFEARKRFLNQVLVVETALGPEELLEALQNIETELGRVREKPQCTAQQTGSGRVYHSRAMDIDILYYDDIVVDLPRLQIPHPRMAEREFVLTPLAEVCPSLLDPSTGLTPGQMLEKLKNKVL